MQAALTMTMAVMAPIQHSAKKPDLEIVGGTPLWNLAMHKASRMRRSDGTITFAVKCSSADSCDDLCAWADRNDGSSCDQRLIHLFEGAVITTTEARMRRRLTDHPGTVVFAGASIPVQAVGEQSNAPWGLDAIDDAGPDGKFVYPDRGGQGVEVMVIDTGVNCGESEFGGRCIPMYDYYSSPSRCSGEGSCAADVDGHGTHCAGTVGGTTFGVNNADGPITQAGQTSSPSSPPSPSPQLTACFRPVQTGIECQQKIFFVSSDFQRKKLDKKD